MMLQHVPAAGSSSNTTAVPVSAGPVAILRPNIIRLPVSRRPVVAAAGAAALPTAAPQQHIMCPMVPYDPVGQRATWKVAQSKLEMEEEEEREKECVICLDNPKSTLLKPCGHLQMCKKCCKAYLAAAESKGVKPQVTTE